MTFSPLFVAHKREKTIRKVQPNIGTLVAHDCGYPLSRYTCRATRVAADFLDFIAFCRCSRGVAPHPLKLWCRIFPPPIPGRCRTEIWVWKGVALHGGVAGTVAGVALHCATKHWEIPQRIVKDKSWKGPKGIPTKGIGDVQERKGYF